MAGPSGVAVIELSTWYLPDVSCQGCRLEENGCSTQQVQSTKRMAMTSELGMHLLQVIN